jgi:hypothetical protein
MSKSSADWNLAAFVITDNSYLPGVMPEKVNSPLAEVVVLYAGSSEA